MPYFTLTLAQFVLAKTNKILRTWSSECHIITVVRVNLIKWCTHIALVCTRAVFQTLVQRKEQYVTAEMRAQVSDLQQASC